MQTINKALTVYRHRGLSALMKSIGRFAFSRLVKNKPAIHYVSAAEYLISPEIENRDKILLHDRSFWTDRYLEVRDFYGMSNRELLGIYGWNGFLNHAMWNQKMIDERASDLLGDEQYSPSPDELLEAYQRKHFSSINRMMLGYHRYDLAEKFLDLSNSGNLEDLRVLDYGCGVADPALYLATLGADATIVDLDTKVLDFAIWRFNQREINHNHIRAEQTERPVTIDIRGFDYVIMSEFLEHVRNPLKFLKLAIDKTRQGGLFYDPVGREYTHNIKGDHLKEAKEVVESEEYQSLHENAFTQIEDHFYKRT